MIRLKKVGSFLACLWFITSIPIQAATVYWDFENGFTPSTVTINPGDSVTWINFDPYGFDVVLSLDGYNPYLLRNLHSVLATFPDAGTYSFSSDSGDTGTVIVNAPAGIMLETPRLVSGQFLFDATGLTVGKTNVLQSSTNLTSWTAIQTNVAADVTMTFTNSVSTTKNFYQLFERP